MPPISPTTILNPFNAIDIIVIVIVKTQAHPLPLKRPHATRKLAIEIPISIPPIRPIYRISNTVTEPLGSVAISVPFTFIVIFPSLLGVS